MRFLVKSLRIKAQNPKNICKASSLKTRAQNPNSFLQARSNSLTEARGEEVSGVRIDFQMAEDE